MEKSNRFKWFIGIDVSKGKLDIYHSGTGEFVEVANDFRSIGRYVKGLACDDQTLVVIDLTGGYEADCVDRFCLSGFAVHRAEGKRVKSFARAMGQLAKTDRIDAKLLAEYGDKMQDKLDLYPAFENALKPYVMRLVDLKDMLQKEKNRVQAPGQDAVVLKSIRAVIKHLEGQIASIESLLEGEVKKDRALFEKRDILVSQAGVGIKSAHVLLGMLPELGHVNRRKIAAIAGVAPYAKDSGNYSGHRFVRGGRKEVKKALFMCALVAARCDPKMKAFYEKLCNAGKPKILAITALMRKIIIVLNAKTKILYVNKTVIK
jgi:transposase